MPTREREREGERGARRVAGQSAGGGPGTRQALQSARAAFFYPELSAPPLHHHHTHRLPHPNPHHHHGVYVDTIITDSNGNTSRYDSSEHILLPSPPPPPAAAAAAASLSSSSSPTSLSSSPGAGGSATRLSGQQPRDGQDRASWGGPADSDPFCSLGVDGSERHALAHSFHAIQHQHQQHHHNNNNNFHHNVNDVRGMSPAEGVLRDTSPGTPSWRSSQGASPKVKLHHSARGPTTRPPVVRRRSSSSSDDMSQESPLPTPTPQATSTPFTLNPDPGHQRGSNLHHIRAASFREPKMAAKPEMRAEEEAGKGIMGQARRNSMPNVNNLLEVPGAGSSRGSAESPKDATRIRRVRSFKTTSKGGIVNRGDSFKKKSTHSLMSTGSTVTDVDARARCNSGNNNNSSNGLAGVVGGMLHGGLGELGVGAPAYFRVRVMGAAGVGKTSMAHQFLTSESVDHDDTDESHHMTVTVLLDGEESTIEFIDSPNRNGMGDDQGQPTDAYVVVFAINDHDSFIRAEQLVRYLRVDYGTDRAILLVANKIDLVRKRKVTADEARLVATTFDCKYAEISAALNHHVDELLVGIITQIRLQLAIPFTTIFFPHKDAKRRKDKKTLCKGPKGFFSRLFRRSSSQGGKRDKGVDNLLY